MLFLVLLPLRKLLNTGFVVKMKWYMSNTAGVLLEAGSTYLSRAPGFTLCVWWGPCCSSFYFFVLYSFISLSSSCVLCNQCWQCLWIVHSWLHLRFYVYLFSLSPWLLGVTSVYTESMALKLSLCFVCVPISNV